MAFINKKVIILKSLTFRCVYFFEKHVEISVSDITVETANTWL